MSNQQTQRIVIALAVVTLVACSSSPSSPASADDVQGPAPGSLSLAVQSWETISQPFNFPLSNDSQGRLLFDFPATGSMNYLYSTKPPATISGVLSVTVRVTTTGPVVFNHVPEAANTCVKAASVRPFFWANRNGEGEFDRWWPASTAYDLAPGSATLRIPLVPELWTSVFGKSGTADAAASAGFAKATQNVTRLGVTFGGGCFYGHGVFVQGGRAQFMLVNDEVRR